MKVTFSCKIRKFIIVASPFSIVHCLSIWWWFFLFQLNYQLYKKHQLVHLFKLYMFLYIWCSLDLIRLSNNIQCHWWKQPPKNPGRWIGTFYNHSSHMNKVSIVHYICMSPCMIVRNIVIIVTTPAVLENPTMTSVLLCLFLFCLDTVLELLTYAAGAFCYEPKWTLQELFPNILGFYVT